VSLATAREQTERVAADLRQRFPIKGTAGLHIDVQSLHDDVVATCARRSSRSWRRGVRAAHRLRERGEPAARARLGARARARRARHARQLAAAPRAADARRERGDRRAAAALGLALAYGGIRLLVAVAPEDLPRLDDVRIDPLVLGFTVLAALLPPPSSAWCRRCAPRAPTSAACCAPAGARPASRAGACCATAW
jgi:hypothetical protein